MIGATPIGPSFVPTLLTFVHVKGSIPPALFSMMHTTGTM